MSLTTALFTLVIIFVVGWFALGNHFNVRKGNDAMRWLQEGLPLVGEKTTLRWLGSSVVELKIQQAKAPFRHAELLVVLEPRDVAPLWGLARLRGRRDLFIFRGKLRSQPKLELEAFDPASWSLHGGGRHAPEQNWSEVPVPGPLTAFAPRRQAEAAQFIQSADLPDCPLVRLSVRQTEPNLEVQWRLAQIRKHSARDVLEAVRHLSEQL
jgi:hypothetical protein